MSQIEELCNAAAAGNLDRSKRLLAADPTLATARHETATALHFACLRGHHAVIELLLAHGADLNARDGEYDSPPIGWANESGQSATVEFLDAKGAAYDLGQAAAFGKNERVRVALGADPSIGNRSYGYGTPLHLAALWGHVEIVELLLKHGADPSLKSKDGHTVYQIAQRQSEDGRTYTPIVTMERAAQISRNCKQIVRLLNARATEPS
jgi:uncharacterized protein